MFLLLYVCLGDYAERHSISENVGYLVAYVLCSSLVVCVVLGFLHMDGLMHIPYFGPWL